MPESPAQRQSRILQELQHESLFSAYLKPEVRLDLEAEADDPTLPDAARLVRRDMLQRVQELLQDPQRRPDLVSEAPGVSARTLGLFFSTDLVVVVPGFLGSALSDVAPNGYGLIWINPNILFRDRLGFLELGPYEDPETDLNPNVHVEPTGVVPILYDLLRADLEPRRYSVALFPVDWRKDLDASADRLRQRLEALMDGSQMPIHVVAHSQGALVARRALQKLHDERGGAVLDRVKNLVLLGPANYGTFAAASALAGQDDLIRQLSPYVVAPPQGFREVLQSMTGLYQLLPWDTGRVPPLKLPDHDLGRVDFWQPSVDGTRLGQFYGWGAGVDTTFFNDHTTVILGDNYGQPTPTGVAYVNGQLLATQQGNGDGTVPDACAYLDGVATYRAKDTVHLRLPTYLSVLRAVTDQLAGRPIVNLEKVKAAQALAAGRPLAQPQPLAAFSAAGAARAGREIAVPAPAAPAPPTPTEPAHARACERPPFPAFRRLRTFAFDPSLSRNLETSDINQVTLNVPWEDDLQKGPVGEYLEVVDADPAGGCCYEPVDLNDPYLLAQDGLAPSEGNPKFHQQAVYAVAMTTISTFEQALGRPAAWSPRFVCDANHEVHAEFVPRLRVYPHALREANAYYSPDKKALLFGYFTASASARGYLAPGGTVFACLSHDIVAHETTHALLDGLHRYFHEPSNPDVLAFHEAFADVVALFQHFSHPGVLRDQIARTRGDLAAQQNYLGSLAVEFGQARGLEGALRDAIGRFDANGRWIPNEPRETDYEAATEPHARGAVLVAAVFDAYLTIYKRRIAALLRVSSNGTGILPAGAIHPDLVALLAEQAAKAARHVLQMCIRALDYVPPVDITFGEYLRALITADADLVPDDDLHYRLAVIDAFARRGIYPPGVRSLSVENLLWRAPADGFRLDGEQFRLARNLATFAGAPTADRRERFERMRADARLVHELLRSNALPPGFDRFLGLSLGPDVPPTVFRGPDGRPAVEVHSVRAALRASPDGQTLADLLIEITQRRRGYYDANAQRQADAPGAPAPARHDFVFRGGCTLLIDMKTGRVRYAVAKDILAGARLERQRAFLTQTAADQALRLTYSPDDQPQGSEPFGMLHRL